MRIESYFCTREMYKCTWLCGLEMIRCIGNRVAWALVMISNSEPAYLQTAIVHCSVARGRNLGNGLKGGVGDLA
jgi:hypothetical protein